MRRAPYFFALLLGLSGASAPCLAAKILLVRKGSPDFAAVAAAVSAAVGQSHQVSEMIVDSDLEYDDFSRKVRAAKPDLLVLMDNKAVNLALRFNAEPDAYAHGLRAVATMALNLKKVLAGNQQIAGVAYEVPALSILSQFRYLTTALVHRVLTIYRKQEFGDTIEAAKTHLRREGIELIAVDADAAVGDDLKAFLDETLSDSAGGAKVDAIWVVSDNALLTSETFGPVWVEKAHQLKIPFLCGIDKFAAKDLGFCTFAASPDHIGLGHQVAEMVFAELDDQRPPAELGVEYIVAVKQTLNLDKLHAIGLDTRPDRMQGITLSK